MVFSGFSLFESFSAALLVFPAEDVLEAIQACVDSALASDSKSDSALAA